MSQSFLFLLFHAEFLLLVALVVVAIVKPENLLLGFASISLLDLFHDLFTEVFCISPIRLLVCVLS